MNMYFGDVSLCYTNSLAMALDSVGVDVRPEHLEALMVMGNGASIMKDDPRHPLVFFDNGEPDVSISNCLRILGFTWEDFFVEGPAVDLTEVRDRLAGMLARWWRAPWTWGCSPTTRTTVSLAGSITSSASSALPTVGCACTIRRDSPA